MENLMKAMKVGAVKYTARQLDTVDLDFQVGRQDVSLFPFATARKEARKGNQHVARGSRGWVVIGEGNTRATAVLPTQSAAKKIAVRIAKKKISSVIVHKSQARRRAATVL